MKLFSVLSISALLMLSGCSNQWDSARGLVHFLEPLQGAYSAHKLAKEILVPAP